MKINEKDIKKAVSEGMTYREMSSHFGVAYRTIWKTLKRYGLSTNNKPGPRSKNPMPLCVCGKVVARRDNKYCADCISRGFNKIKDISACKTDATRKRILKEQRGIKCEICGITEWTGEEVPLVLDHIDGNSSNNLEENLRLVCGNCDMLLPTYKNRNKGNGRAKRRKRYAIGRSF